MKTQKRRREDWRPMLMAKPIPNARAEAVRGDDGGCRIAVPRRRPWYWMPPLSWMQPFCERQTIVLDRLSRRIWELCDGERTVEKIVETFAAEERLSFHEARVAVTQVIEGLVRRGGLAIALPNPASAGEKSPPVAAESIKPATML